MEGCIIQGLHSVSDSTVLRTQSVMTLVVAEVGCHCAPTKRVHSTVTRRNLEDIEVMGQMCTGNLQLNRSIDPLSICSAQT